MKVITYAITGIDEVQSNLFGLAIDCYKNSFKDYIDNPSDEVYQKILARALDNRSSYKYASNNCIASEEHITTAHEWVRTLVDSIDPKYRHSAYYHIDISDPVVDCLFEDNIGIPIPDTEFSELLKTLSESCRKLGWWKNFNITLPYIGTVEVSTCYSERLAVNEYQHHYRLEISDGTYPPSFPNATMFCLYVMVEEDNDNG